MQYLKQFWTRISENPQTSVPGFFAILTGLALLNGADPQVTEALGFFATGFAALMAKDASKP